MCFSPAASFAAAGVLAPAGAAALARVHRREQLLLGVLPLAFAVHQAVEGVVWLGVDGAVGAGVRDAAVRVYLLFAQVALPVLVPVAVAMLESRPARRRALLACVVLGAAVAARMLWVVLAHPVGARASEHSLVYATDVYFGWVVAAAYILVTCGSALLSSVPALRWFGLANLAGLTLAAAVQYGAVTSIWCFQAALMSVAVLVALRRPQPILM